MSRELYIIRHGQTEHNAKGIIQGRGVDLPLNEKGRRQAQAFFEAYKHVPFDMIYTSSLRRAKETAAPFAQLGIPQQSLPELDEISWGNLEGAVSTSESSLVFQNLLGKWRNGDVHARTSPSGESPHDLQQRQLSFLQELDKTKAQKILIATHGRFIRAFLCTLTGKPLSDMETFHHVNLCLYKLQESAPGQWNVELTCETGHLKDIA